MVSHEAIAATSGPRKLPHRGPVLHVSGQSCCNRLDREIGLAGYRTSLYDRLYRDWRRIDAEEHNCRSVRKPRQESVWLNF